MKFKISFIALLISGLTFVGAQETAAPKFGKGLFNLVGKDSSWTMKIGIRMQTLAISTWEDNENPETNFLIRRSRLKFDGYAVSPKLKYKIELGLSNKDISGASPFTSNSPRYILDAVLKWNFHETSSCGSGKRNYRGTGSVLFHRPISSRWTVLY